MFVLIQFKNILKASISEQNLPSQNMSLWNIDYIELKLFEKQLVKEDTSYSLYPSKQEIISHSKAMLRAPGGREGSLLPQGIQG